MRRRVCLLPLLCLLAPVADADADTVWFEVASHGDRAAQSFLLPLSAPADIIAAREQLALRERDGQGALVMARIQPGGDGLNRNLRDPGQRLWSWHVSAFDSFAELSIELCDGSPALVEADPVAFAANTGDWICFWGYSIAAELAAPPTLRMVEALDGFWHAPGSEGSGFMIDVLEAQGQLALAWLRYAPEAGPIPRQQWWLGLGELPADESEGATVDLVLAEPAPGQGGEVPMTPMAPVRLEFVDCNRAFLTLHTPTPTELALVRSVARYGCNPD